MSCWAALWLLAVDAFVLAALSQVKRKADYPEQKADEEPAPRPQIGYALNLPFLDADALGVNKNPNTRNQNHYPKNFTHSERSFCVCVCDTQCLVKGLALVRPGEEANGLNHSLGWPQAEI